MSNTHKLRPRSKAVLAAASSPAAVNAGAPPAGAQTERERQLEAEINRLRMINASQKKIMSARDDEFAAVLAQKDEFAKRLEQWEPMVRQFMADQQRKQDAANAPVAGFPPPPGGGGFPPPPPAASA